MKSMVDYEIKCPYCFKGNKDEGKQSGAITCSGCGKRFKYQRKLDIICVLSEYMGDLFWTLPNRSEHFIEGGDEENV